MAKDEVKKPTEEKEEKKPSFTPKKEGPTYNFSSFLKKESINLNKYHKAYYERKHMKEVHSVEEWYKIIEEVYKKEK